MKNIKSTPFLLILVLALLCFASCDSKESLNGTAKNEDFQTFRAKHIGSQITTNIIAFKDDKFVTGDTVWTKFNDDEQCLEIIYDYSVDMSNSIGSSYFKVVILPSEDSVVEVYTSKDILFYDLSSRRLFSETGDIDTTFVNQTQGLDFLGTITARHTDI